MALAAVSRDLGVDVSLYDGSSGVSQSAWNQMHTEGQHFAFIKASECLTGPDDTTMTNNVTRATAAGIRAGVYHVAHAENRPTTDGAIQEADHFLSFSGTFIGPGRLRPVLNLEQNNRVWSPLPIPRPATRAHTPGPSTDPPWRIPQSPLYPS